MRKRVLFLFMFLLIPHYVYGDNCADKNQTDCKNTAGCQYYNDEFVQYCGPCKSGNYCPGVNDTNKCSDWEANAGVCHCPTQFPFSTPGRETDWDCYAPCTDGSDDPDNTVTNCGITKIQYDTSVGIYSDDDKANYVVSCIGDNGALTWYDNNELYHAESRNDFTCYLNTRPCEKFGVVLKKGNNIESITPNTTDTFTGNAIWTNESGNDYYYSTTDCTYERIYSSTEIQCETHQKYQSYDTQISKASNPIVYNVNTSSYYCKQCTNSRYYPTTDQPNGFPTCNNPNNGHHKACKCEEIQKGYYGSCIWDSTKELTACKKACPMGQTTTSGGSISSDDCHYSNQTKFCDAKGCFTLTEGQLAEWGLKPNP